MKIIKSAIAGTTESSDVQITITSNEGNGVEINLKSIVQAQFGESILKTVQEMLKTYEIEEANVQIEDKGAFDRVIRARMQTAIFRASGQRFKWKEVK